MGKSRSRKSDRIDIVNEDDIESVYSAEMQHRRASGDGSDVHTLGSRGESVDTVNEFWGQDHGGPDAEDVERPVAEDEGGDLTRSDEALLQPARKPRTGRRNSGSGSGSGSGR